jgi:hypothetical protein
MLLLLIPIMGLQHPRASAARGALDDCRRRVPAPRSRARTTSERLVRFLNKTPIHIALGIIAVIWLRPRWASW